MIFTIKITTLTGDHITIEADSENYKKEIINKYYNIAKEIVLDYYNDMLEYIK